MQILLDHPLVSHPMWLAVFKVPPPPPVHQVNVFGEEERNDALPLSADESRFCIFSVRFSNDGNEILGGANRLIARLSTAAEASQSHGRGRDRPQRGNRPDWQDV